MSELSIVLTTGGAAAVSPMVEALIRLPHGPPLIIVDNASGLPALGAVRSRRPDALVFSLNHDLGASAYALGAAAASTPLVAFCGDGSWWTADSLRMAASHFDAHSRLGLLTGRVLLWPQRVPDPASPTPRRSDGPGRPSFSAGACVVRRSAFLDAGGFQRRLPAGARERLLAFDMAAAGWSVAYSPDLVAHRSGPGDARASELEIDEPFIALLRRSRAAALRATCRLARAALRDREARKALRQALSGLPWLLRNRKPLPPHLEQALALLGY